MGQIGLNKSGLLGKTDKCEWQGKEKEKGRLGEKRGQIREREMGIFWGNFRAGQVEGGCGFWADG